MEDHYVPQYHIQVEDRPLAANLATGVESVAFESTRGTADVARVRISDVPVDAIDSDQLRVGGALRLRLGYADNLYEVFVGQIAGVEPIFQAAGRPNVQITAYDRSYPMRHNWVARDFHRTDDTSIVLALAAERGLTPVVDPSPTPPRESWQHTGSDWALLMELAARNGFEAYVRGAELHFRGPNAPSPVMELEWGAELESFRPRLRGGGEPVEREVRSYDERLGTTLVAWLTELQDDSNDVLTRLLRTADAGFQGGGQPLIEVASIDEGLAVARAAGRKAQEARFEATGTCAGRADLAVGHRVDLRGLGQRFSGLYRVSGVRHEFDLRGFRTTFQVAPPEAGSALARLRKSLDPENPPDRRARALGLELGLVQDRDDPDALGRVRVHFPHLSDSNVTPWARVATLAAGEENGFSFVPELGEEVLVGFVRGDRNEPIVLGSLWNGRRRPGVDTDKGHVVSIKTRAGHEIRWDDEPGRENLSLRDSSGNTIRIDSDGVRIEASALEIAAERVKIKSKAVDIEE